MNDANLKLQNKLLICDMDGTMLNSQNLVSDKNIKALKRYVEAGGLFTVATGRLIAAVEPFVSKLPVNVPAILGNGLVLYDFIRKKVIKSTYLEDVLDDFLKDIILRFPSTGVLIYTDRGVYCFNDNEETEHCRRTEFINYLYSAFEEVSKPWYKILFGDKSNQLKKVDSYIKEKYLAGEDLPVKTVFTNPLYMEMLPGEISKGDAADELTGILGIRMADVYAVGDSMNDLELIQRAGTGIAVKNACSKIKKAAEICVGSNDEDVVEQVVSIIEEHACT